MDSVILGTIGKIEHCATLSTYSIESDLKKMYIASLVSIAPIN